jgi:hypothetical protein
MLNTTANIAQVISVFVIPVAVYGWKKLNKEMHNNGGSTIRDAIDRIERDVKANRKDTKRLRKDLEEHLAQFED